MGGVRGPKSRALGERPVILLTVWPSVQARELGGLAIRSASASLAYGDPVEMTMPTGESVVYPPTLPDVELTESLTSEQVSVSVSLPWAAVNTLPKDLDWRYAVGEVSVVWTTDGGEGVQAWGRREIWVGGVAAVDGWGSDDQFISVTVGTESVEDDGDFFAVGAELNDSIFTDIGTEADERSRAFLADGTLPPYTIAPEGSGMYAPMPVVVDEVDAVSGVSDLQYRQWLYSFGAPPNAASTRQFNLVPSDNNDKFAAGGTSVDYQAVLSSGTTLDGRIYYYVSGAFSQEFGVNSVTFTNASADVTATKTGNKIAEGDQVKATTGGNDDWVRIESRDGDAITLASNYGGATLANQEGDVIRLPAKQVWSLWETCTYGGNVLAQDGTSPLTLAIDVLDWAMRKCSLPIPIAFGDLQGLRNLVPVNCQTVISERQSPLEWADAEMLSWLPIRRYVSGGVLRFAWVGPVEHNTEASIDLTEISDAWRESPVGWSEMPAAPVITVRHNWNYFRERFSSASTLVGDRPDSDLGATEYTSCRVQDAWAKWRDRSGQSCVDRAPVFELESMVIGPRSQAVQVADHLLYQMGIERRTIELELGPAWAWLRPGALVEVSEPDTIETATTWRVEVRTMNSDGMIRAVLTEVIA